MTIPAIADLVVLGSGAAGLAAALRAAVAGASVVVLEKSIWIGGTTAMSGGCIWIPDNPLMKAAGLADSFDDALAYLCAVAPPGWAEVEEPAWRAFLAHGPAMLSHLLAHTPLVLGLGGEPDPYLEATGARRRGRNVSPRPLRFRDLGTWATRIRPSPMPYRLTYDEITDTHLLARPSQAFTRFGPRLLWRTVTDRRAMGQALVGGLLSGCLRHGALVVADARALSLQRTGDRVDGVTVRYGGREHLVRARRGIVIATGGFEWDPALMAVHHPGPHAWTASPETNTGDGHRMAAAVGARLERMDQALVMGTRPITYQGQPHAMPAADYTLPHSMIVDARGRRFVNEVQLNIGLGVDARDPVTGIRMHAPAWRIYDGRYARLYPHALPKGPERVKAPSLRALAARIGVDPVGLEAEAARMSRFAREGHDEDFGRGSFGWDPGRNGDPRVRPNSCLGTIEEPPFFAFPLPVAFLGTKGGPRTDVSGRVIGQDGAPIAGLFCAGLAMANAFGSKAVGAGTTLGPCLTWGYICAGTALHDEAPEAGRVRPARAAATEPARDELPLH